MNWYGLDWTGILLAVFIAVVVNGFVAAYGGHLTAESIRDKKQRLKVKRYFWGIFILGSIAVTWQTIHSAVNDVDRDTKDAWAQALSIRQFAPPPAPVFLSKQAPKVSRTYVTMETPELPPRTDRQDINFKVGDDLAFNVSYSASGSHPVVLLESSRWLYVEHDIDNETQSAMVADFKSRMAAERNINTTPHDMPTLMPGKSRFFTTKAWRTKEEGWRLTEEDLQNLANGAAVAFVMAEITYEDAGVVHHARQCAYLQPPARSPGVWHFCDYFNNSD